MSWPLTGKPLAEFNRLLSDWRQYGTFPFLGPDDINRLYDVLVAAGVTGVTLTDLALRPQYWLIQLSILVGSGASGFSPVTITGSSEEEFWKNAGISVSFPNAWAGITSVMVNSVGSGNGDYSISGQDDLISFSLGGLTSVGNFNLSGCNFLTDFEAPSLISTSSGFQLSFCGALTTLSLPVFVFSTNGFFANGNSILQTVSLPSFVPANGTDVNFSNCALDAASVNSILALCVANPSYVSGTVDLSGGTNAAPSGQGIADVATLLGRGVNVTTN